MSKIDLEFHKLCSKIQNEGREYENKNRGVKRLQIPSYTLRHSFSDGFPAITNKKLYWKGITTELLWFLRGDNDVKFLNDNGVKIWNKDAYNWYKKDFKRKFNLAPDSDMLTFEEFEELGSGSVGANYSKQWRDFQGVDQISNLIEEMKSNIMSSRLKVNAWNPAEIFDTALPPCHSEFQVIGVPLTVTERIDISGLSKGDVENAENRDLLDEALINTPKFGFELHWNQRSVDTFLGLPFNIASYGLLAKILENITGYKALGIEGTLKCVHFYDNQYEAVKQLLKRDPEKHHNCELRNLVSLWPCDTFDEYLKDLKPSDLRLIGYTSDDAIKVDMLAPKE